MSRVQICPPNRRGHTWKELSGFEEGSTTQDLVRARICARCGARGRVNNQGLINVVRPPEVER